jgi:hypothetical protein
VLLSRCLALGGAALLTIGLGGFRTWATANLSVSQRPPRLVARPVAPPVSSPSLLTKQRACVRARHLRQRVSTRPWCSRISSNSLSLSGKRLTRIVCAEASGDPAVILRRSPRNSVRLLLSHSTTQPICTFCTKTANRSILSRRIALIRRQPLPASGSAASASLSQ